MNNKLLFSRGTSFIFLFIILIGISAAASPFQTTQGINGIQIETPVFETIKADQDFIVHIHAHNLSSGIKLDNATISCVAHLFDITGDHISEGDMIFDSQGGDWEYLILGGNFTSGQYSIMINCEDTDIGGFLEYTLSATPSGLDHRLNFIIVSILLLTLLLITIATIAHYSGRFNFENLRNKIDGNLEQNNPIRATFLSLFYTLMSETFLLYYLLIWPILITLNELMITFGLLTLQTLIINMIDLYSIGLYIVGLLFIGQAYGFLRGVWNDFENFKWGTN